MKFLTTTMLFCFTLLSIQAQKQTFLNHECGNRNLTIEKMDDKSALNSYLLEESKKGMLKVHPFTFDEIGGWESFKSALTEDENTSFEFVGINKSRLMDGYFYRYQQYYRGVAVLGGGFTILVSSEETDAIQGPPCPGCPPGDPCATVRMISPYVYEDISTGALGNPVVSPVTGITPAVQVATLASRLSGVGDKEVKGSVLRIAPNAKGDCNYRLIWATEYDDALSGEKVAWIDAMTGEVILENSRHLHKNAPTADWGVQDMNDSQQGNNTVLQNDRLAVHNMGGVTTWTNPLNMTVPVTRVTDLVRSFNDNQIPQSPTTQAVWTIADAPADVFQAFWMTDQAIGVFFDDLNISFEDVHVGVHPTARGAVSFNGGLPNGRADFAFGVINGQSTVEYDIVAHELGHSVIRQFIDNNPIAPGSLHEGIADMIGTYIESRLDALDWVMGDAEPELTTRDLQNTARNCFTDVAGITDIPHNRSEALSHWFFLCVNGDVTNNIPAMDILDVLTLVLEALPNIGRTPDYPDLMAATVDLAAEVYGTCSDQFLTIIRAWEQICLETNHWMAVPNAPCVTLNASSGAICEETGTFSVCLSANSGVNANQGRWNIIGRNATGFQSYQGMDGNLQVGGNCIAISSIPNLPFYPQEYTFLYWNSAVGERVSVRLTIRDCDGDDPSCGDYYETQGLVSGSMDAILESAVELAVDKQIDVRTDEGLELVVYDLYGHRLHLTDEQVERRNIGRPMLLLFTYWTKEGELVATEKVMFQ